MAETYDDKAQEAAGKTASVGDVNSGHEQRERAAEVARVARRRGMAGRQSNPLLWVGVGLVGLIAVLMAVVLLTSGLSSTGDNDKGAAPVAPVTSGH